MAGALRVLPVLDDEDDFLHPRQVVGPQLRDWKFKARPIRVAGNRKQLAADQAVRAFEFNLDRVIEIAVAATAGPEAEPGDADIFHARRIAGAVAQQAVKVGEVQRLIVIGVLADERMPGAAKAGRHRVVHAQRGAVGAMKDAGVKRGFYRGRLAGKGAAVAGETIELALVVEVGEIQFRRILRRQQQAGG